MGVREAWGRRGNGRRRAAVVLAVVLVAVAGVVVVAGRDGSDGDGDSGDGTGAEPFDFPPGQLLVPAGDVREYPLTWVAPYEPAPLDHGTRSTIVTRFEDHVVTVTTVDAAGVREAAGVDALPDPRVATVQGRPTVDYGWHLAPLPDHADNDLAWYATDDLVVHVAGRGLDEDDLVRVAEAVEVTDDGRVVAPGEIVGEIPGLYSAPRGSVGVAFERRLDDGRYSAIRARVLPADRSVQEAYLALAAPDGSIDASTHYSCCAGPIPSKRKIEVGDRMALAAALTADEHVLVLPGDDGAVVLFEAGRVRSVPTDVWLADLAASLTPVAPDDLEPIGPQSDGVTGG
ncbi:MAG TPA: hypothetical protein VIL36_08235 [Acidimicrobiales bacterium]